jgi:vacuolar-type H+-ATPase subunit H
VAEKALSQIRDAEAQAQIVIKNAQEEASHIIKDAEDKTASAFIEFSEICKQQGAEKKRQTEKLAQTSSLDFSKQTAELCLALKQELSSQKSTAVDAVIHIITT